MSFAVALPAVLGVVGLATDYGVASSKESKLQTAADQAAMAAVKELTVVNASETNVVTTANLFAREQLGSVTDNVSVNVEIGEDRDSVRVIVKEEWAPLFAHFLGTDVTPIVVSATAKLAGKTNLCLLALAGSDSKVVHMDKSAKVKANGCAIYANSTHSESVRLDADSQIEASLVCTVGGVKAKTSAIKPTPTTDCPKLEDPLAARLTPAIKSCDESGLKIDNGSRTLKPGRYCEGLKITGDAKVKFEPGEYVVSDGQFEVSGNASISGANVAFFLHGTDTTLYFTGDSTIALTGAATGTMAGLLFYEDRSSPVGRTHRINSSNAHTLTGTIYLPNGSLRIDPNSSVGQNSAYTAIIANKVEIDEGPTLVLNDNYGDTNVPVPEGIRTDTQVVLVQ